MQTAMTGHFTSAEQAEVDEAYFDVTLHMVPIWPAHSTDAVRWLYVEQAITAAADRPYRQRVYRLSDEGLALVSAVYELPGDAQQYVGAWRDVGLLAGVGPDDLVEREGCAITLIEGVDGSYVGSTNEADCKSTLRGATYATSRVTIRDGVVESWDQGFDAAGEQVWGAEKGPYVFRRVD
ncbi:MAG: chromophore lyase CpcT/CpeT [Planctomycetota bacterium]